MTKTNIEVSLKKLCLDHKNIFQKTYCLKKSVKLCFLVTFNDISYIFLKNFTEIHQVYQIWIFTSSILTIAVTFVNFFTFTCYKINNDASIYKIIPTV